MYMYFKTLHDVANSDPRYYGSIKDLTIRLAQEAGYRRGLVTLKNGKQVERTIYNDFNIRDNSGRVVKYQSAWNDVLVAKWLCYFEKLFKSKLGAHPEIAEYYPFIIQRTFSIYINALQIDKLKSDAMVVSGVNQCLGNRIGEAFGLVGSQARLDAYNELKENRKSEDEEVAKEAKGKKNRIIMKFAFSHMTKSLDNLVDNKLVSETTLGAYSDDGLDDDVVSLKLILANNPMGERTLEAMLNSSKKFNINKVNDYIKLTPEEARSTQVLLQIKEAYLAILKYLSESCELPNDLLEEANILQERYSRDKFKFKCNQKTLDEVAYSC